ncbi:EF-hand and coiled-coil domain-containing protein 1 isoform X1 [Cynoglossus semilaevis]|uniref:EF-hand and coiled-coil domain-containing protein 1-like n=1 Tax=Cynoglossus semilaevis TaxID=244447 RepID=A0A3P8VFQ8_CYNSE|nr:EF-hand and coiled-coil domain-containing protein 1-like isoform X1 [Cynoglossus semilaevis]
MERTAVSPSPRAARKSQWLRSALAHHHCPDPGVENEIVVLATGIDQYLQEVFHHLAYTNQEDVVTEEDFTALCAVLGLGRTRGTRVARVAAVEDDDEEEFRDVCSRLPSQLSFKDFHSRLCEYFRVRSARRGDRDPVRQLPPTDDTELVQRQIRLRWPRRRRRKCVSFDLSGKQSGPSHVRSKVGTVSVERETDELSALRELVEDLRSALQSSDARCLALEVALRRSSSSAPSPPSIFSSAVSTPTTSITFQKGKLVPTQRIRGQCIGAGGGRGGGVRRGVRIQDMRDPLMRELKLIRSSRDGQLEEAIRFNERLEQELQWAYEEVRRLQALESTLRKENAQIRRRAEEAREALSLGLHRVRLIQEQARAVPKLQARIGQLESELQQHRPCCKCVRDTPFHPGTLLGDEDITKTDAEGLQRAVEGRAASDEEEEDRGASKTGQCCESEVKKHLSRQHSCGKGCRGHTVSPPSSQNNIPLKNSTVALKGSRQRTGWREPDQEQSQNLKEVTNTLRLEEKLRDVVTLLLQLCNQNMSGSVLGKIVVDTVGVCSKSRDGASKVLQVADALCLHLSSGQPVVDGLDGGRGEAAENRDKLLMSSAVPTLC